MVINLKMKRKFLKHGYISKNENMQFKGWL